MIVCECLASARFCFRVCWIVDYGCDCACLYVGVMWMVCGCGLSFSFLFCSDNVVCWMVCCIVICLLL